jgi:predicted lipoprotein with Yx(FWY)xxD motif
MLADSEHGEILVDAEGRTLYMFVPDEETGEPTCYEDCATNWPPLVADGEATVGEGLDDSLVTTVPRTDDAGEQVKYGDWPLYLFANDAAPGDTNGQGVGEVWYVVGADGEPIR